MTGPKGHFIWLVDKESTAEYRPVVVGDWHGSEWFIYEGLHAGDQVVVDGGLTLRPDMKVKAVPMGAKTEGKGAAALKMDSANSDSK